MSTNKAPTTAPAHPIPSPAHRLEARTCPRSVLARTVNSNPWGWTHVAQRAQQLAEQMTDARKRARWS